MIIFDGRLFVYNKVYFLALTLLAFNLTTTTTLAQHVKKNDTGTALKLNDILPANPKTYDKLQPPRGTHGPARVAINVIIESLDSFDEKSMSFSADIFLSQRWIDHRLRVPNEMKTAIRRISTEWLENLWYPDLFLKNAKDSVVNTVPNTNHYIWFYKEDKTILYVMKIYLTLTCNMNFAIFPHDIQTCKIQFESLSSTKDDVIYVWDKHVALKINENITLPQYNIIETSTGDCSKKYAIGQFSCVEAVIKLTRNQGFFMFETYVPMVLTVILSWVPFWMDPTNITARIISSAMCFMCNMGFLARTCLSTPMVYQVTAIELFAATCTLFTFLALIQFFVLMTFLGDSYGKSGAGDVASTIDLVCRIVFPLLFFSFTVAYWIVVAVL